MKKSISKQYDGFVSIPTSFNFVDNLTQMSKSLKNISLRRSGKIFYWINIISNAIKNGGVIICYTIKLWVYTTENMGYCSDFVHHPAPLMLLGVLVLPDTL